MSTNEGRGHTYSKAEQQHVMTASSKPAAVFASATVRAMPSASGTPALPTLAHP